MFKQHDRNYTACQHVSQLLNEASDPNDGFRKFKKPVEPNSTSHMRNIFFLHDAYEVLRVHFKVKYIGRKRVKKVSKCFLTVSVSGRPTTQKGRKSRINFFTAMPRIFN